MTRRISLVAVCCSSVSPRCAVEQPRRSRSRSQPARRKSRRGRPGPARTGRARAARGRWRRRRRLAQQRNRQHGAKSCRPSGSARASGYRGRAAERCRRDGRFRGRAWPGRVIERSLQRHACIGVLRLRRRPNSGPGERMKSPSTRSTRAKAARHRRAACSATRSAPAARRSTKPSSRAGSRRSRPAAPGRRPAAIRSIARRRGRSLARRIAAKAPCRPLWRTSVSRSNRLSLTPTNRGGSDYRRPTGKAIERLRA